MGSRFMNMNDDKSRSEDLYKEFLSRRESGEDVLPEDYFTMYPELGR